MVKMVHNNYNTTFCVRSKTHSKTSNKTISVAASLIKRYQVVYEYNLASAVHNT